VGYTAEGLTSVSSLSMPTVLIVAGSVCAALFGFVAALGSGRKSVTRPYSTWDGGFGPLGVRTEHTATSLSQPLRTAFKWFYRPHTSTERTYFSDSNRMVRRSVSVVSGTKEVFEEYLYSPTIRVVVLVMDWVRRIQTGKINSYLLYVMIATAVLLLLAALQP
jgi:hydrogenase-4 component B